MPTAPPKPFMQPTVQRTATKAPAPPAVYRPNNALPVQRKTGPPVYRPISAAPLPRMPVPPAVYRPNHAVPVQQKGVPLAYQPKNVPPMHRNGAPLTHQSAVTAPRMPIPPSFRPVIQRSNAPKYILEKDSTTKVRDKMWEHFHLSPKTLRIKEHSDSDFVVSSFLQIAKEGKITLSNLPLNEGDVSKHELRTLKQSAIGINGLTVDDGEDKIIHLLQGPNIDCTLVHEALHAYSHSAFGSFFGKDLDEGATELFAREIMKKIDAESNGPPMLAKRGKVYTHEVALAETLIDTFGRDQIVNAYFKGEIQPIYGLVLAGFAAKQLNREWNTFKTTSGKMGDDPPFWELFQ